MLPKLYEAGPLKATHLFIIPFTLKPVQIMQLLLLKPYGIALFQNKRVIYLL